MENEDGFDNVTSGLRTSRQPLLPRRSGSDSDPSAPLTLCAHSVHTSRSSSPQLPPCSAGSRRWRTLYICICFIFVVHVASFIRAAPKVRMFELGLCREYFNDHEPTMISSGGSVLEKNCKLEEIQRTLAYLKGWLAVFEGIPGILLSMPYGILADKKGRTYVAALSLTGQILEDLWTLAICQFHTVFKTKTVWAGAAFRVIGGGPSVLNAIIFVIIADIALPMERMNMFFYTTVAILAAEIVAPPFGSLLMDTYGPLIPFGIGIPFEISGYLFLFFIPDTLRAIDRPNNLVPEEPDQAITGKASKSLSQKMLHTLLQLWVHSSENIDLLMSMIAFLANKLVRQIFDLLLQYTSVYFHWTLAQVSIIIAILSKQPAFVLSILKMTIRQAGYLLSFSALVNIFLFIFIGPYFHSIISRRLAGVPVKADLFVARYSVIALALGAFGLGAAPNSTFLILAVMIFTLGCGFRESLQSFMTSLVNRDKVALLYTKMLIIDAVGSLVTAPLLASTFSAGLHIGGFGVGLPYFVSAGVYLISGVCLWSIR